jgi:hypothetical protein
MTKKTEKINIAITETLKRRFLHCLELEGIDQTSFIIGRIHEFVNEVEKKEAQRKKTTE